MLCFYDVQGDLVLVRVPLCHVFFLFFEGKIEDTWPLGCSRAYYKPVYCVQSELCCVVIGVCIDVCHKGEEGRYGRLVTEMLHV